MRGRTYRLKRLTREGPGVVTINRRTSDVRVYWYSPNIVAPVARSFWVHAASVPEVHGPDFERGYQKLLDPAHDDLRWQHAKVGAEGRTGLALEPGPFYLFYLTPGEVDADELRREHVPWPVLIVRPEEKGDATVLALPVPPLVLHSHDAEDEAPEREPESSGDGTLLGFGSSEHQSALGPARLGRPWEVQGMLDDWASAGLIDGGAMVDTKGPFSRWTFLCPGEAAGATLEKPYGKPRPGYSWHYVLPDPKRDANGVAWTGKSLKRAVEKGDAVALAPGHVTALAGDLFGAPQDMEDPDLRPQPVHIVAKFLQAQASRWNRWQGYEEAFSFLYMMFDVLLFHEAEKEGTKLLEYLRGVSQHKRDALAKIAWDKVEAAFKLVRLARGRSRFSEIHLFTQGLGIAGGRRSRTLGWLEDRVPALSGVDSERLLKRGGATSKDIQRLKTHGIEGEFFDIVGSYGRYAALATKNKAHFSEPWSRTGGWWNYREFKKHHVSALELVRKAPGDPTAERPIPARAIFLTAFGCHFLTDGFSAGHLRVPRTRFDDHGALAAKLMHDMDGYYGLTVTDRLGNTWRAFGDGYLRGRKLDASQKSVVDKVLYHSAIPGYLSSTDANYERMQATVGAAFKQLLLEAYRHREPKNGAVKAIPGKPDFETLLDRVAPSKLKVLGIDNRPKEKTLATGVVSARGSPGPGPTVWDDLAMSTAQKSYHLSQHMPVAAKVGEQIYRNHPPLFHQDGAIDGSDSYQIIVAAGKKWWERWGRAVVAKYQGFVLRLTWHGYEDFWDDSKEIRLPFDQFYFLTIFARGIRGLEPYEETKLLELYEKLDKQLA